jgi:hypothetical protein
MQSVYEYVITTTDLILVVSSDFLLQKYPDTSNKFDQLLKLGFSIDEYPGKHIEPSFSLESNCSKEDEIVTFVMYYQNCDKITIENASSFCAFLSINYLLDEQSVTLWNLCSMDRGKGYAGKLVDVSIQWTRQYYNIPLRLKVYVYNSMFEQVMLFYLKRHFSCTTIERGGSVVCLIHDPSTKTKISPYHFYSIILHHCWQKVLTEPQSQERKWLASRLLSLFPKQRL